MQTIPRALVDPPRCINILSEMLCGDGEPPSSRTLYAEMFFSFVKPNSSISRQGQENPKPNQQQYQLTPQTKGLIVNVNVTSST